MKSKIVLTMLLFSVVIASFSVPSTSAQPYDGYNYSYWGDSTPSPIAYLPARTVDGKQLGIGDFKNPEDLFVAEDGHIYLLDSGNARIVMMNADWSVIRIIEGFINDGKPDTFANPQGIFVTSKGNIYVADTDNSRVVELENDGTFVRVIGPPKSDIIRSNFQYIPRKVALDKADRIFVIGKGVFDGIIEFDSDGGFTGFMGTNRVRFNVADYFWKQFATKAQRDKMIQFVPIEFSNLHMDSDGFIYSTTSELNSNTPIQRLNPTGIDVLRREGYHNPTGDLKYNYVGENAGSSIFSDIVANDWGMYYALDSKRGRIFTYNEDGSLLYVFGRLGNQAGTFKTPVAIERTGDNILIVDRDYNQITVFEPTRFGTLVNQAEALHSMGKDEEAAGLWQEVLRLNANYEIAYIGIGKSLLRQHKDKEAMKYFKLGYGKKYYSKAFGFYRRDFITEHFGTIITGLISLFILLFFVYPITRNVIKRRRVIGDAA